jgi:hypothetical protein
MFCAPGLIFGGTDGVESRFHVLRGRTRFRQFPGHWVLFSCFALRTHFRGCRVRRLPFSSFACPDSFSAVPGTYDLVLMFSAPRHIFGGTDGVRSLFYVLRARTRFRRLRGRRVLFSCFARPDSFWAVPRASGPVFIFCAPGLDFDGSEGVGSRIHDLRARTHFRRYRWRRVAFSCFALPDSFSAIPRASRPVFLFYAPGLIFGGTEGVGSRFHVLRSRTNFRPYRCCRVPLPDALGTADAMGTDENKFGSAKYENETRRHPHRRKLVRARKT